MSETKKRPTIRCAPNGPYLVSGLSRLRNSKGEGLEAKESMALCRCGGSARKPFCDGTHSRIGFESRRLRTEPPTHEADRYEGKGITILDNRTVCAHAGVCTEGLPAVWRMKQEPWIDPDGADRDAAIQIIRSCPSGALSYELDGKEQPPDAGEPAVVVSRNGPYAVIGGVALEDAANGQTPHRPERYTLCRCGQSKNKPFCDGAHWDAGFTDDGN